MSVVACPDDSIVSVPVPFMSQGRQGASSELDQGGGTGYQPHTGKHSHSTSYALPVKGLDRKLLRQGSLTHADYMGTSQQLGNPVRKADKADSLAVREITVLKGSTTRLAASYGGSVPPVVPAHATRTPSRPPSSSYGNLVSPRQYSSNSYRDAALVAAQHGLSAYAQSAAAAASRTQASRSNAGGRPPPAPRANQHSAPSQTNPTDCLPSCSGVLSSRSNLPAPRSSLLVNRNSAPMPTSPAAAHRASDTIFANPRLSEVATVTITCNDLTWRGAFESSQQPLLHQPSPPDDSPVAGLGPPPAMRVMSPGWGIASPSVFEADGRPGTRGGGPQYDMEGRPTTRGGQRPPSRAQLNMALAQPRPPGHVAPLGPPGWAGLFASGSGTGSGESCTAPAASSTSPRAPSAGGTSSSTWSGEGADRRCRLPLPLAAINVATGGNSTMGLATPAASGAHSGLSSPSSGSYGVLPLLTMTTGQSPAGLSYGAVSSCIGSCGSSGVVGAVRPFSPKLTSIAEIPGSPVGPVKSTAGRVGSGGPRKASRERPAGRPSAGGRSELSGQLPLLDGSSEEGGRDDSYTSAQDQDGSSRGGSRTRPRSTVSSRQSGSAIAGGSYSVLGGRLSGVQGSSGPNSPTHENPSIRPRR